MGVLEFGAMGEPLRYPVGRTVLAGYLVIRPEDEHFFGPVLAEGERPVRIAFGGGQQVDARLYRARSTRGELKLAYTGKAAAGFRAWLKRCFPARKSSKVRGVLVVEGTEPDLFRVRAESVSQAEVELVSPGPRRYLAGAKPVCVLHPAMLELEDGLRETVVPDELTGRGLRTAIEAQLRSSGWEPIQSVGGGLALGGGLGLSGAQLHLVTAAVELVPALVAVAAGFELGGTDLGVLLVADGRLAEGLRPGGTGPAASCSRAEREAVLLDFLLRGPIVLIGLGSRKEIR